MSRTPILTRKGILLTTGCYSLSLGILHCALALQAQFRMTVTMGDGIASSFEQRTCVQKLRSFLVMRDRLVKMKGQITVPLNESAGFTDPSIRKAMQKHCKKTLTAIQADIKVIEKQIIQLIRTDESLNAQYQLITSVPGVGPIVACNFIVCTGEFKIITEPKKFACYAGVAPFEHSSGSSIRGRTRVSRMANMTLKWLLHLAAMSAIQCSDEIRQFYERKVSEGKNKMSVLNAVRNKLISRIFSCIKNNREYEKHYQNALA